MKKGPFGKFAVDVDNGFEPYYVVDADKKKKVASSRRLLKDADELFLATDEDREGEAIAWHLLQELKPKVPVKRMVFHEITREAIQRARRQHPRARRPAGRRAGDPPHPRPAVRLRGQPGAVAQGPPGPVRRPRAVRRDPAGRRARAGADGVRSRRLLGRRRRLRRRDARADRSPPRLTAVDGARVATGRDFADDGTLTTAKATPHLDEAARHRPRRRPARRRRSPSRRVETSRTRAARPRRSPRRRCSRRPRASCGSTAGRPMRIAQRLYENGYITYMRTDSLVAVGRRRSTPPAARPRELYGAEYVPGRAPRLREARPRTPRRRTRPSGPPVTTSARPAQVAGELRGDEFALYELIWKRTVASQMADARGSTASVRLGATRGATAATSSSPRPAPSSRSAASSPRTRRARRAPGDPAQGRRPRRSAACRSWPRATALRTVRTERRRAPHLAAAALHRGHPGQGAGGARHRPPVDVRRDDLSDPGPRVRDEPRAGARADLARVRGDPAARGELRPARRLRLHRRDGGGPRRDRGAATRTGVAWLSRFYFGDGAGIGRGSARPRREPRRHRRPRGQLRSRSARASCCASAATARTSRRSCRRRRPVDREGPSRRAR